MRKAKKIFAIIGAIIVVAIIGIGIWQKDNIVALWQVTQYSEEEIAGSIETTKEEVKEALDKYNINYIRDLTLEEEEQIRKGELSVDEAISRMVDPVVQDSEKKVEVVEKEKAETSKSEEGIVAKYTAQIYSLKAKYIGLLGGLESRGWQALGSIPSEERSVKNLQKVGMPLLKEAMGLESQCNGEVEEVLGSLQAELKEIGADTAIVDTMRQAYYTEKGLKKSYYMSLLPF